MTITEAIDYLNTLGIISDPAGMKADIMLGKVRPDRIKFLCIKFAQYLKGLKP